MKKVILFAVCFLCTSYAIAKIEKNVGILTTAQNVTNAYANVGDTIEMLAADNLGVYIDYTANDSTGLSLKVLAKRTKDSSTTYELAYETGSTSRTLAAETYDLPATSSKMFIAVNNAGLIPFAQLQIKAGTVGSLAAKVNALSVVKQVVGIK